MVAESEGKPTITTESPLAWLQIIPSTDPSFSSEIQRVLGSSVQADLGDILPYSVVLNNLGTEPLVAIGIRFQLRINDRFVKRNFFYHSFERLERPVLGAGESSVFTPSRWHNAYLEQARATKQSGGGTGGLIPRPNPQAVNSMMRDLASAEEIHVSIDLVIVPDGRAAGPDKSRNIQRFQQSRDAYAAMRKEAMTRLARGDSDQLLEAWLAPLSTQIVFRDPETGFAHRFTATQRELANEWLAYLRAGKRSTLEAFLAAAPPETTFAFLGKVQQGRLK